MRNFRTYHVWQHAMDLVSKVYLLTSLLPMDERYSLARQIQRSAVSIPSNVAEGCSRSSEKEFKHFIEVALGSSFELETQLILGNTLYSIDEAGSYQKAYDLLLKVQAELNALRNKL